MDAPASGAVTVSAEDYSGHTVSTTVSPATVNAGSASFTYDANGNMTSDGTKTYYWNALDRLVGVLRPGYEDETRYYGFEYDGLGRRTRITTEMRFDQQQQLLDETWFLWDKLTIAQERETKNGEAYRWHFDRGYLTDFPDEREIYNQRSYFKKDHLGSIRAVYRVVPGEYDDDQFYSYDAYGNFTEKEFDAPHPGFQKMFTGHFFHRGTGLCLAPYRAYDPQLGRWLSREPLGLDGPNLYWYTLDAPISSFDVSGLQARPAGNAPPMPTLSPNEPPYYLPDPGQRPPGWNPQWPVGTDGRGPHSVGPDGTKYYPHTEDHRHWPHYDTENEKIKYRGKCEKLRSGQKRPPYGRQSPENPWPRPQPNSFSLWDPLRFVGGRFAIGVGFVLETNSAH